MSHETEAVWYFAYGSNLSVVDQKTGESGEIREAIPCRLNGYRLTFTKFGRDGTCKANLSPDPDAQVWGVAYLCDRDAFAGLDRSEGVADGQYATSILDGARRHGLPEDYVRALERSIANLR